MVPETILAHLAEVANSADFAARASELTEQWAQAGVGSMGVEPVLRFMEQHPTLDYGMPGPLVHFVERFYGQGYEQELLRSLARKPTSHTVWMLNRVINGTRNSAERHRLIEAMQGVVENPATDNTARGLATGFLARLLT